MRRSGQVTVFLGMILLCMCALLCTVVESARMAGARWHLRIAAGSALDSVMAGYHRELWESYRLLLREFGSEEDLEEEFLQSFSTYFEGGGWYPGNNRRASVRQAARITEEGGRFLEQEILDYMKYGIWTMEFSPGETGDLKERLKEAQAVGKTAEIYSGHGREAVRLEEALEELDSCLMEQKELKDKGIQALDEGNGGEFQKIGKELIAELEKTPRLVETYGKRADELAEKLQESRRRFDEEAKEIETIFSLSGTKKSANSNVNKKSTCQEEYKENIIDVGVTLVVRLQFGIEQELFIGQENSDRSGD